ncbi:hypothetical protein BYT27DRAFT_6712771 [Phlegmacium glaucopus]|nr:hypothetical protein BYT27DRAFT_6712771 [Phlegmacium glaucopus]
MTLFGPSRQITAFFSMASTFALAIGYSIHDYSSFGFPATREEYVSSDEQRRRLRRDYEKKRAWMDERGLCVWNGNGALFMRESNMMGKPLTRLIPHVTRC